MDIPLEEDASGRTFTIKRYKNTKDNTPALVVTPPFGKLKDFIVYDPAGKPLYWSDYGETGGVFQIDLYTNERKTDLYVRSQCDAGFRNRYTVYGRHEKKLALLDGPYERGENFDIQDPSGERIGRVEQLVLPSAPLCGSIKLHDEPIALLKARRFPAGGLQFLPMTVSTDWYHDFTLELEEDLDDETRRITFATAFVLMVQLEIFMQ